MDDALFLLNRDDESSNPVTRKLLQQQRDHDVLDAFIDVLPGKGFAQSVEVSAVIDDDDDVLPDN